jgi:hypothetical protein
MGERGCPQRSIYNYQNTLINPSEERKPQLHRVGNMKYNETILGSTKIIFYRRV